MARSLPAVAVVLILALAGGHVVATACEITCSSAEQGPSSSSRSSASRPDCHRAPEADTTLKAGGMRTSCAHAIAAPFVVPGPSSLETLRLAALHAVHVNVHDPAARASYVLLRLNHRAPLLSSATHNVPLRI